MRICYSEALRRTYPQDEFNPFKNILFVCFYFTLMYMTVGKIFNFIYSSQKLVYSCQGSAGQGTRSQEHWIWSRSRCWMEWQKTESAIVYSQRLEQIQFRLDCNVYEGGRLVCLAPSGLGVQFSTLFVEFACSVVEKTLFTLQAC